jgi:hypothetical protein
LVALLANTTRPLNVPAAGGVNLIVTVTCDPAASVVGSESSLTLYIFTSGGVSLLKATLEVPVFVIVTEMLFDVPTATSPKFAAVGLNDSVPAPQALLANSPAINASMVQTNAMRALRRNAPSGSYLFLGKNPCKHPLGCLVENNERKRMALGLWCQIIHSSYALESIRAIAQKRKIGPGLWPQLRPASLSWPFGQVTNLY